MFRRCQKSLNKRLFMGSLNFRRTCAPRSPLCLCMLRSLNKLLNAAFACVIDCNLTGAKIHICIVIRNAKLPVLSGNICGVLPMPVDAMLNVANFHAKCAQAIGKLLRLLSY